MIALKRLLLSYFQPVVIANVTNDVFQGTRFALTLNGEQAGHFYFKQEKVTYTIYAGKWMAKGNRPITDLTTEVTEDTIRVKECRGDKVIIELENSGRNAAHFLQHLN